VCELLGIQDLAALGNLHNKKVFLRVDANVSARCDNFKFHPRIRQVVDSIETLRRAGARVIIASHHSTPDGASFEEKSKAPLFLRLIREFPILEPSMSFLSLHTKEVRAHGIDERRYFQRALAQLDRSKPGEAIFLENIRLLPIEKRKVPDDLPRTIAESFDFVVNDAFGVGHRFGQFSVDGIAQYLPVERKAIGPSALNEWRSVFNFVRDATPRSIAIVLGGDTDKFGTKLLLLNELLTGDRVGLVYLGGVFGTTYLHACGGSLGLTPISGDPIHHALLTRLPSMYPGVRFDLPNELSGLDDRGTVSQWKLGIRSGLPYLELPNRCMALDQSPHDLAQTFSRAGISRVLAVGPLGYYVRQPFQTGTIETYRALARWAAHGEDRRLLVGGGNSVEALLAVEEFRDTTSPNVTLSSGGGALLNAVAGVLNTPHAIQTPAIKAFREKPRR
jgi:phosphoglycerate kinase